MITKKKIISIIAVAAVCIAAVLTYSFYNREATKTITIGAFAGSYWDVPSGNSYKLLDNAIMRFEKEHPNISVEYVSGIEKEDYSDWLYSRLLEGNAPDVFFVLGEDFNSLSELGAMKDLTRLIAEDEDFKPESFYTTSYSCGQYANSQYALPYESAVDLMFVNKTILAEEGISVPNADWTTEDFYKICKTITKDRNGDGTLDRFGVCNYSWQEAALSNGVQLFDSEGNIVGLNSDEAVNAVSFLERIENLNNGYTVTTNDFDLGRVAFQPMLFSEYRAYKPYPLRVKKYSSFEWDCITMPRGENGTNTSYMNTLMLAVNRNTKNEKYAWELMKLLTCDEEIQSQIFRYSEGASPLKSVTNSEEIIRLIEQDGNIKMSLLDFAIENATVEPSFRVYDRATQLVDAAVREILDGNSNISMALIKKQKDINTYLKNE